MGEKEEDKGERRGGEGEARAGRRQLTTWRRQGRRRLHAEWDLTGRGKLEKKEERQRGSNKNRQTHGKKMWVTGNSM